MATQADNRGTLKPENSRPETLDDKRLDQAAEKAGKTEQRYDQSHKIFTK